MVEKGAKGVNEGTRGAGDVLGAREAQGVARSAADLIRKMPEPRARKYAFEIEKPEEEVVQQACSGERARREGGGLERGRVRRKEVDDDVVMGEGAEGGSELTPTLLQIKVGRVAL